MNYCSEVSHFSYKNTVLLIQLKKFKWLLLQEKFRVPRRHETWPCPHHQWLPKDSILVTWGQVF